MDEERTQLRNRRASDHVPAEPAPEQRVSSHKPVRIRVLNAFAIVVSAVLALFALVTVGHVLETEARSEAVNKAYQSCTSAARVLQEASDYLTSNVRVYVVTGNREYMDAYLEELEVTNRRGKAVATLRGYFDEEDAAVRKLDEALSHSNALAERELYAMKLVALATELEDIPPLVANTVLSSRDANYSSARQRALAEQIVLGEEYQQSKAQISDSVNSCSEVLLDRLETDVAACNDEMHSLLFRMQIVVAALLIIVVFVIFAVIFLILWPLAAYTHRIVHDKPLVLSGARELRYLAEAYNLIYEENRERTRHLKHAAERDALTGLYNRGAYDDLLKEHVQDVALLLIDVDYFKGVNDTYGHDMGDAVLRKVANLIEHSFRNSDFACRVGGDEFAVIMTDMHPQLRHVVVDKLASVRDALLDTSDGLPEITLSIGVAFSAVLEGDQDLYKAADEALYVVKESGRNGCAFYGEGRA